MGPKKLLLKVKEYQTLGLFATLGVLTLLVVLFFKVVLFAPAETEVLRLPAHESHLKMPMPNISPEKK